MQHLFSWTQYLLSSIAGLIGYYTVIVFKFYRKELFNIRFSKQKNNSIATARMPTLFTEKMAGPTAETVKDNLTSTVHDFDYELKTLLKQLVAQKEEKAAILESAANLVTKYQTLKGSHFQTGLANLVAAEIETICGLRLTADELKAIWE
ncbi:MAG: hypothetical protein ABIN94_07855 [Ferruginibacter sp.]